MRNLNVFVAIVATVLGYSVSYGQQVAGFDDLNLDSNSQWIGSNHGSNDFTSGFANFSHFYDTTYYSWNGFAYSNVRDTITEGWNNQYASRPGIGAENTSNYGIFYQWLNDSIWFDSAMVLDGIYVTNSTYTALTVEFGDAYSKKFGGETGNDPDWFLLTIKGFDVEGNETGTIEFYLADYRFGNNDEDYILTNWQWVDLSGLEEIRTLKFSLSSTDNGDFGMNTPAYFCLDELKSTNNSNVISVNKSEFELSIYQNPFSETITVESEENGKVQICNLNGQVVFSQMNMNYDEQIDLSSLEKGIYFLSIAPVPSIDTWNRKRIETRKIVKL